MQKWKFLLDIIVLSIGYALIFTGLVFFVFPLDLRHIRTLSELITAALGAALFFGAFSGFTIGFIASTWVNRLEFHSQITIGMFTGILVAIIGSIFFPPLAAFIRLYYFRLNPVDFIGDLSLLANYSMIGVISGTFSATLSGILGGLISPSIY